jgi:POT family proton-dependent oligopeptide transporter
VGDQFGQSNQHLLTKVYGWFYLSINIGATTSTLLTPVLLRRFGPHVAFAVPGVLMGLATLVFWMGSRRYVHVPPAGRAFFRETFSSQGMGALARLALIYICIAPFWAVFEQNASTWVEQAKQMDRRLLGIEWEPAHLQAVNPLLVLILVPLFSYVLYPAVSRVWAMTPLRRISVGLFLTALAAYVPAQIQIWLAAGLTPSIAWQVLAYIVLTSAEVMVSITALEFSYTQAPKKMKSLVMGVYLISIATGNLLAAAVNQSGLGIADQGRYTPTYFWFFVALTLAAAIAFAVIAARYRERTHMQDEAAPS